MKITKALSKHLGKITAMQRRREYDRPPYQKLKQNTIVRDETTDGLDQAEYWLETGYGLDDDVHLYP